MTQETVVPQELLKKFNGTLVYRGKFNGFISRGDCFVTRDDNKFLRNGTSLIYEGDWDGWRPDTQGNLIVRRGNKFIRNGTDLIYEGGWSDWEPDNQGNIIICRGKKLFRNGTEFIYEGEWGSWRSDAQGNVIIQLGNCFFRNGTELVYHGTRNNWWTYRNGIMVQYDERDGTKYLVYYNPFDHTASPFDD